MRKNCTFLLIGLFLLPLFTNAQKSTNIDTLISKASLFYKTNQDSAYFYASRAYDFALKTDNNLIIAKAAYHKSIYLILQKKYLEASKILNAILENKSHLSNTLLGDAYYNLGSVYYLKEERDKALENYLLALSHYEEDGYKKGLAKTNLQIGVIYEKLNRMEIANYFYDASLAAGKSSKSNESRHSENQTPKNISAKEKIALSKKMLQSVKVSENPNLAAIINYNLAISYLNNKDYSSSIRAAQTSLKLKQKIKFKENIDVNYAIIGKSYFFLKDYKNAIYYLTKAKEVSQKRHLTNELSTLIIKAYSQMSNYKKALEISNELIQTKDSVNTLKENEEIARITAQFETEKQAKEILILKQEKQKNELLVSKKQNKIWKWSLFSVIASLIAIFLGRKLISSLKRIKKVEEEKKEIAKKVEEIAVVLNNKSKVYLNTLKYIKSDGNYLEFITNNKTIIDRNKLKDILVNLPPNFVRVHRSYVVNKNFINASNSKSVILKHNIEIPLSRTFKSNIAS